MKKQVVNNPYCDRCHEPTPNMPDKRGRLICDECLGEMETLAHDVVMSSYSDIGIAAAWAILPT